MKLLQATVDRQNPTEFLHRVESLRGVLAAVVGLYHGLLLFSVGGATRIWEVPVTELHGFQEIATKTLLGIANGTAAVTLFFVISGLVLGLSLDRACEGFFRNGTKFLIRRIFRIYPAMIGSVLVIAASLAFLTPIPNYHGGSEWLNMHFRTGLPFSASDVLDNILFTKFTINHITWTLKVEMAVAVVFPLLHFLSRRVGPLSNLVVLACLAWTAEGASDSETIRWLFAFYSGLLLPLWGHWLAWTAEKTSVLTTMWLGAATVAFGVTRPMLIGTGYGPSIIPLAEVFGATMILANLVYGMDRRCFKWLDSSIMRAIGRVSYSFYLYNFIVLYLLAYLAYALIPSDILIRYALGWNALIGISAIGMTLPLASVSYRYVEKPLTEFSKNLTRFSGHEPCHAHGAGPA